MIIKGSVGINNSSIAVPVDLQYSNLDKDTPVPVVKAPQMIMSTIVTAATIVAGADTGDVNMGLDGTEAEVYVCVNINKFPWTLSVENLFGYVGYGGATFPLFSAKGEAYSALSTPAMALVMGVSCATQGITAPTTMAEAKANMLPYIPAMTCRVKNSHATDDATITVRILRIWR